MAPSMSAHFAERTPSAIRLAQICFAGRDDGVDAVNTAIGNVCLPMHPALQERLRHLAGAGSPFAGGVVKYTPTVGENETNQAILNIIASSGGNTAGLLSHITAGGSQAMELVILGVCGPAGSRERPLLLIDPAYTNYTAYANRLGRRSLSVSRTLGLDGRFSLPHPSLISRVMARENPGALVIIPYDNPTGQIFTRQAMIDLASLCVAYDTWIVSDEAYRELYYDGSRPVSIWSLSESDVPGISGRRISIETASKVWNACGLRIGAVVTDSPDFHDRCVAENTTDLCASAIGQYIFGALADESHAELRSWYDQQRAHYAAMMKSLASETCSRMPGVIVSRPDAAIYGIIDVRNLVSADFEAEDFVLYCAKHGRVDLEGRAMTLLAAPMSGFYSPREGEANPGRTQMRIAFVETPERMAMVPRLLSELLRMYLR